VSDFIVEADLREKTGRGEARRMRRAGNIPAVIYGGGKPELPITLNALGVTKYLDQETFYTSIVEIKVKGSRGTNKGLVKDVQWHPVRDEAMHIEDIALPDGVEIPHDMNFTVLTVAAPKVEAEPVEEEETEAAEGEAGEGEADSESEES